MGEAHAGEEAVDAADGFGTLWFGSDPHLTPRYKNSLHLENRRFMSVHPDST
jgi:hypothetical protein